MLSVKASVLLSVCCIASAQLYELNIVHYNDFHARFVETSLSASACNPQVAPCIGGFARTATLIRQALEREPDSIVLNGGDSFQGTIWYNLLKWNVTQEFMNMIPHDAHVLGNHEFDNGIEGVVPYLRHLNSTVVVANIIDDEEPDIQGLYQPSVVVERKGRKIGIIGVIISTTNELASIGNLSFTDEIEAARREAEKLHEEGVDIIVVLSHCGLEKDQEIALKASPYIDIVVGAHSHSLLINTEPPAGIPFVPQGPYPIVVEQENRSVLVVQAAARTAFVGEIKLYFNEQGDLVNWSGEPHFAGNDVEQAPDVLAKINEYLPIINEKASEFVGTSKVQLSSSCSCAECNLGSFICDAFMNAAIEKAQGNQWNYAHLCLINTGGVRVDIDAGNITFEKLLSTTPFEKRVEVFDLKGQHVLEALEFAVANDPSPGARMLQISGLRVVFDGLRPVNSRIINATVRCNDCDVPRYEPLDVYKTYKVVTQSFIGEGGDGFWMIANNRKNVEILGLDYEVLMDYVRQQSPIVKDLDGRIVISNPCLQN
ncbi:apyrase-like [Pararge aegeria]|uniref:apyrase n=1 Tax=Pararge aegeria aegeria TaxID=348720 RepID=A0A8S4S8T7_9NEOP|nr:apyrase-like [Pararge aegeria]CAH2261360.1 jg7880 [Pararge aegeria aegeria]